MFSPKRDFEIEIAFHRIPRQSQKELLKLSQNPKTITVEVIKTSVFKSQVFIVHSLISLNTSILHVIKQTVT